MRRAKIVCTMGPAALAPGMLENLVAAGMDCARLNFSHGSQQQHLETAERVRAAAAAAGRHVSILADLQGPKIRVGVFANGPVELVEGAEFRFTGKEGPCNAERACISYPHLAREVHVGAQVLLDDGLLALRVERIEGDDLVCRVEVGGPLSDRKGVNLPGAKLSIPALTEKDCSDLEYAVNVVRADYLALSFVRSAEDVLLAQELAKGTPVIAKLEKPEVEENLESILDVADGVMVARGDLGVELGPEKVPMVQKRIIREANRRGKLVITATQMLDSMIRNPRPTRAEAADVANAILDGTDAVMLSGETASGRYPVQAVKMMCSIVREAEEARESRVEHPELANQDSDWEFSHAAARAAALLTTTLPLAGIVVVTSDGRSADLLSSYRPRVPVFALTPDAAAASRLAVRWGVVPRVIPTIDDIDESRRLAADVIRNEGPDAVTSQRISGLSPSSGGVAFALVTGWPPHQKTNTVTLHRLDS